MSTIVNFRGTSGSGKSYIVRALMAKYKEKKPDMIADRKRPVSYHCFRDNGPTLFVPGHYEIACGGCDTLSGMDYIYGMINAEAEAGCDVVFEGLIISSDTKRCIDLKSRYKLLVIELATPLEQCLDGIRERRAAKGNPKEVNPDNTRAKMGQVKIQRKHWQAAGIDFRILNREDALVATLAAFGWEA